MCVFNCVDVKNLAPHWEQRWVLRFFNGTVEWTTRTCLSRHWGQMVVYSHCLHWIGWIFLFSTPWTATMCRSKYPVYLHFSSHIGHDRCSDVFLSCFLTLIGSKSFASFPSLYFVPVKWWYLRWSSLPLTVRKSLSGVLCFFFIWALRLLFWAVVWGHSMQPKNVLSEGGLWLFMWRCILAGLIVLYVHFSQYNSWVFSCLVFMWRFKLIEWLVL